MGSIDGGQISELALGQGAVDFGGDPILGQLSHLLRGVLFHVWIRHLHIITHVHQDACTKDQPEHGGYYHRRAAAQTEAELGAGDGEDLL